MTVKTQRAIRVVNSNQRLRGEGIKKKKNIPERPERLQKNLKKRNNKDLFLIQGAK